MGAYYYIVNHTSKQYAGYYGKKGEFDIEAEALLLGWNITNDDIDEVPEYDIIHYDYEYVNKISDHVLFRSVYNFTKNECYRNEKFELKILTQNNIDELLMNTGWNKEDKLIYTTFNDYYYPNVSYDDFNIFFNCDQSKFKIIDFKKKN